MAQDDSEEPCRHLLDPATCTICNGSDRRRAKEAAARREAFLRALRAGLIKFDKPDPNRGLQAGRLGRGYNNDHRVYQPHGANFEDDNRRFNRKVR